MYIILIALYICIVEKDELLIGLKNFFNVYFSNEETEEVTKYLDEDGSGDVDYEEFSKKVNFNEMHQKASKYTITRISFINLMLKEWEFYKEREKRKV